ncbi:winged helix-turn-helix domain-containing protein [Ideonella margarita]|uniref:Winged helix-turn-helix domain-containing protein n=1 Tax=Ideonella margarita TaxID=2984191 RepID=A0ABU9C7B5_9BURK
MLLSQETQASNVASSADAFHFGGFQLQPDEQRLLHHGEPVTLQTRALDVLTLLVSQPGRLITRADLLRRVWRGLVVEDNNLNVQISALRKVLGKSAIATVPGKGYRFNWPIRRGPWLPRADAVPPAFVPAHSPAPATEPAQPVAAGASTTPAPVQGRPDAGPWPTLLGRQHELTQLLRSLRQAQWVSLAGPPGVGKSRLAQVAAWRHAAATGVPAAWVDLAPVCALQDVVLAVAAALNLPRGHDLDDPWWTLRQQLGGMAALLVLDNADRLPAELGAVLAGWLAGAPGLRVLLTRQRPFHQRGELVCRLDGLALPPGRSAGLSIGEPEDTDPHALAAALAVPSVALLVQQVKLADARFEPQAADLPALCALAHALDGWPLALEQAAARVPALGLAALPALMGERLNLLTATPPSRLQHSHPYQPTAVRSLRRAVEASHARLTQRQQRLFRRLAVFEGSADLALMQQVVSDPLPAVDASGVPACHGLSVDLVRRVAIDELQLDDAAVALELAALADASVLQTHPADADGEAPSRSGLWRNMRALALELAVASGEMAALQHAHAAALVRQAKGWLEARHTGRLPHQGVVQRCQQAQGHLRQAWAWANGRHHPDDILALVHALWLASEGHDDTLQTTCLRLLERRAPCAVGLRLWADLCLPPAGAPGAGMGGATTSTLHSATQAFVALSRAQLRALHGPHPHPHTALDLNSEISPQASRHLHHALCARVVVLCRSGEIERTRPLWFEANRLRSADWPALDQLAGATADMAMQQAVCALETAEPDQTPDAHDASDALAQATQRLLLLAHQAGCHWLVGALHWLDSLVATRAWPQAATLAHRVSQQAAAVQPPAWAGRLHLACAAAWLGAGRKGAARQALRRAWQAHEQAGLTAHGQPGWWLHAWLALLDQRLDDAALWLGLTPLDPLSRWPHPPHSPQSSLPPHAHHPAQAALAQAALTPDALAAGRRAVGAMDDIELTARALQALEDQS